MINVEGAPMVRSMMRAFAVSCGVVVPIVAGVLVLLTFLPDPPADWVVQLDKVGVDLDKGNALVADANKLADKLERIVAELNKRRDIVEAPAEAVKEGVDKLIDLHDQYTPKIGSDGTADPDTLKQKQEMRQNELAPNQ